ncbi:hypothetical protein, partial [Rhizobium leguminosarum]|uniref:hypothetical protein n=1 Tax=Rhizobium leguminosarum TaxID=384 RepID=UPI001C970F61
MVKNQESFNVLNSSSRCRFQGSGDNARITVLDRPAVKNGSGSISKSVLPERGVTVHTGDMGYTFCLCEESEGALAGVQPHGRASQIRC